MMLRLSLMLLVGSRSRPRRGPNPFDRQANGHDVEVPFPERFVSYCATIRYASLCSIARHGIVSPSRYYRSRMRGSRYTSRESR